MAITVPSNTQARLGLTLSIISSGGVAGLGILLATRLHLVQDFDGGMLAVSEVILLVFIGLISLVSIPEVPIHFEFVDKYFGFLNKYIARGCLYLVIGIHTFPLVGVITHDSEVTVDLIFRIVCAICVACGLLLLVVGCGSVTQREEERRLGGAQAPAPVVPGATGSEPPKNPIGNPVSEKECPPPFPSGHPLNNAAV